jgi:hypothetical protein
MAPTAAAETFMEKDVQRQAVVGRQEPSWRSHSPFGRHNRFCNEVKLLPSRSQIPPKHTPQKKNTQKKGKKKKQQQQKQQHPPKHKNTRAMIRYFGGRYFPSLHSSLA